MSTSDNGLTLSELECRTSLLLTLAVLIQGKSFWYTLNGNINWGFSLANRLGFKSSEDWHGFLIAAKLGRYTTKKATGERRFEFVESAWHDLIAMAGWEIHNASDLMEVEFNTRVDVEALIENRRQEARTELKLIRLGEKVKGYPSRFAKQKHSGGKNRGKLILDPPLPEVVYGNRYYEKHWRMQRRLFQRSSKQLVSLAKLNDEDLRNAVDAANDSEANARAQQFFDNPDGMKMLDVEVDDDIMEAVETILKTTNHKMGHSRPSFGCQGAEEEEDAARSIN